MEKAPLSKIEIALWDIALVPWVEVVSDSVKRCHIELGKDLSHALEALTASLQPLELNEFLQLWTNDSHPREFSREGDFLLIRTGY